MNGNISVVIIARNEERNIAACIESVKKIATEIIVVDDNSEDNTRAIAERMGAKVFTRSMDGNWGAQQTFAVQQAISDWIFLLDCDERVTEKLACELTEKAGAGKPAAFYVPRKNYFMGKQVRYGGWYPDYNVRLLPRSGSFVEGRVHPVIRHNYPVAWLKTPFIHYTYDSWEQYLNKQNRYSTLAAQKNYDNGKRAKVIRDMLFRPAFAFMKKYLVQRGFLDGWMGLALAMNYANYTLNKYVKLYALQKEEQH